VQWTYTRARRLRAPVRETVIADFVDLSAVGAFVDAPATVVLDVGTLVEFAISGHQGTASITRVQDRGGVRVFYGVEFVALDPALEEFIADVVAGVRSDHGWLLGPGN
jgi:hypothetical protein